MNFPEHQKTGALAEIDVARLFISWGWNVGQDHIDTGYDLCVTPDRDKYRGARFLVQVKGTASKKKSSLIAQVEKNRLRQYAEDLLPVFIVRATPNNCLYWIHAQSWTQLNRDRLSGAGSSGIRFESSQRLEERNAFEAYLIQALQQTFEELGPSADLKKESRILNSLDARLGVRSKMGAEGQEHEIYVKSEPVEGNLTFTPLNSPENIKNLHDAIDFGLPRTIEVEHFKMTGSPLFDYIVETSPKGGRFSLDQKTRHAGMVRLFPGEKFSITALDLGLEAEIFSGKKGFSINNESKTSIFDIDIRMPKEQGPISVNVQIGFREAALIKHPIQSIDALRSIASWVEQIVSRNSVYMELEFHGNRVQTPISGDRLKSFLPFLYWAKTLSRLHLVAKALNSPLTLRPNFSFVAEDIDDIDLAYALLRGERCLKEIKELQFSTDRSIGELTGKKITFTTTLLFEIHSRPLGEIPVAVELTDYLCDIASTSDPHRVRLSKGERGQAWISYAKSTDEEFFSYSSD